MYDPPMGAIYIHLFICSKNIPYSLLNFVVCSEYLRLTRDAMSLHHMTSKWLSDFWDLEIPWGNDLWKAFWGLGSLLCFYLSSSRGSPSISGTMGCTVWVQFKQGWFRVHRVSLVSHVIFAHLARSLLQMNNIPSSSSETTVPPSVMITAELC